MDRKDFQRCCRLFFEDYLIRCAIRSCSLKGDIPIGRLKNNSGHWENSVAEVENVEVEKVEIAEKEFSQISQISQISENPEESQDSFDTFASYSESQLTPHQRPD